MGHHFRKTVRRYEGRVDDDSLARTCEICKEPRVNIRLRHHLPLMSGLDHVACDQGLCPGRAGTKSAGHDVVGVNLRVALLDDRDPLTTVYDGLADVELCAEAVRRITTEQLKRVR